MLGGLLQGQLLREGEAVVAAALWEGEPGMALLLGDCRDMVQRQRMGQAVVHFRMHPAACMPHHLVWIIPLKHPNEQYIFVQFV